MPQVPIKYIVSFSSQDDKHPVSNMMSTDTFKKWLSDPRDRTGVMEAIFQLEYPCCISYINIGSIWCATAEVKVGRSDWPAGREYETLIYAVSLMTPADCTLGKNPVKTEMFTPDSFCPTVAKQQWDRIKVICRQPYKKLTQFGLSFFHVKTTASSSDMNSTDKGTAVTTNSPSNKQTSSTDKKGVTGSGEFTSVKSIKQHFLGKIQNGQTKSNHELKSKLLKIAASSESGVEADSALSRTAKLVLAASEGSKKSPNIPKTPESGKRGLQSNHLDQKYGPQFEEEVKVFLSKLSLDHTELDNMTLADVRHKFEKKKKRKLTKEEKKKFAELTTQTLSEIFNVDDNANDLHRNKPISRISSYTRKIGEVTVSNDKMIKKIHSMDGLVPKTEENLNKDKISPLNSKHKVEAFGAKTSTPIGGSKYGNIENDIKRVTPNGKRKFDALDDMITPPSKKILYEDVVNRPNTKFENSFGVLKAKNGVNRSLKGSVENMKNMQYQNEIDITSLSKDSPLNSIQRESKWMGDDNTRMTTPKTIKQGNAESGSSKKRGIRKKKVKDGRRDSSFGEFLMNMTLSPDDIDSDDDDCIQFPDQKTPGRGRGRGRGRSRGKKTLQPLDSSHLQESPSTSTESSGSKRGRGRGRGRGRTPRAKDSPSINSLEIRPTGFARCEGCGDYYGENLLSVHQDRCPAWKNKRGSSTDCTDSPWLSTRPETPSPSSKKENLDKDERSPPLVMAALAAERRLNEQREGKETVQKSFSISDQMTVQNSTNQNRSRVVSTDNMCDNFGSVVEAQRKAFEKITKHEIGQNGYTPGNKLQTENMVGTGNQSISINQLDRSNVLGNQSSSSRTNSNIDLTMDSDTDDEYMDQVLPPVECPLCGDLFPTSVIEAHAANCGLWQ